MAGTAQQRHSPRADGLESSAASPAHQDGCPTSRDTWALPADLLEPSCCLLCFSDLHRLGAGVCEPLQGAGDLHQAEHGALPRRQLLWSLSSPVSGSQCRVCHSHPAEKRQTGHFPAALAVLGMERILWRVWCQALSIPVPLSEEDELPLQEQYLERELVPSWLQQQSCLPSPGRTGVHCSRVIWGLCVRG